MAEVGALQRPGESPRRARFLPINETKSEQPLAKRSGGSEVSWKDSSHGRIWSDDPSNEKMSSALLSVRENGKSRTGEAQERAKNEQRRER